MRVPAGGEGQAAASEEPEGSAPEAGRLKGSPQDTGAERSPARGKRAAELRRAHRDGTRNPATLRGWRAGSEPSRAHLRSGLRVRFLELPEPARRPRASWLPRVCRGSGGAGAYGVNGGRGLWVPGLQSLVPNFPLHARENPRADPRLCSSSKLQTRPNAGGGLGRVDAASQPPARAGRAAALRRAPSSPVPVVRTGCSGGSSRKKDLRPVTITLESSDSVLIENCQTVSWGQSAAE